MIKVKIVALATLFLAMCGPSGVHAECHFPQYVSRQTGACVDSAQCLSGSSGELSCTRSVPPSCACNTSSLSAPANPPLSGKVPVGSKPPSARKPTKCGSGQQLVCRGGKCDCKQVGGKSRSADKGKQKGAPKKGAPGRGKGKGKSGGGSVPDKGGSTTSAPAIGNSAPSSQPSNGAPTGGQIGDPPAAVSGGGGSSDSSETEGAPASGLHQVAVDLRLEIDPEVLVKCNNDFQKVVSGVEAAYGPAHDISTCQFKDKDDPGCGTDKSPEERFLGALTQTSTCFEEGTLNCSLLIAVKESLSVAALKCLTPATTNDDKDRCVTLFNRFTKAVEEIRCNTGAEAVAAGQGAGQRGTGDTQGGSSGQNSSADEGSMLLETGSASCAKVSESLGKAIAQFFSGPIQPAVCLDRTKPDCGRKSPLELLQVAWRTGAMCGNISGIVPSADKLRETLRQIVAEHYTKCSSGSDADQASCDAVRDVALQAIAGLA